MKLSWRIQKLNIALLCKKKPVLTGFFLSFIVFLNLKTKDSAKINKRCLKLISKVKINQKDLKKRIFHTFQMKQCALKNANNRVLSPTRWHYQSQV